MAIAAILKECGVFSTLGRSQLEGIGAMAVPEEHQAGSTLFVAGDAATSFYVVEEGKIALQMTPAKELGQSTPMRRITVDTVVPHEVLGWSAVVPPHIYTLTAVCLSATRVLAFSGPDLRRFLEDGPDAGYKILVQLVQVVAERLRDTRWVLIAERSAMPGPALSDGKAVANRPT